ncbi:MAG: hypothetical protein R2799_15585 [Crocinitomicaceae bacterium]
MKQAILFSTLFFSFLVFGQEPPKKTLLLANNEVSIYLIDKDSISTSNNKLLIEEHVKGNYNLSLTGASISKHENYWVFRPSQNVKFISISCNYTKNGRRSNYQEDSEYVHHPKI